MDQLLVRFSIPTWAFQAGMKAGMGTETALFHVPGYHQQHRVGWISGRKKAKNAFTGV